MMQFDQLQFPGHWQLLAQFLHFRKVSEPALLFHDQPMQQQRALLQLFQVRPPCINFNNLSLYCAFNQGVRIQVSIRVKIDIENSRTAKVMRRIAGLTSLLLIEDKRATTTAATAIDIGTFQFTAPQP